MSSIRDILLVLKNRIRLIILLTMLGTLGGVVYAYLYVEPVYTSSATLTAVNNVTTRSETDISQGEMNASSRLVTSYVYWIQNEPFREAVSNELLELGYDVSVKKLGSMLFAYQASAGDFFVIYAKSSDKELAQITVNTAITVFNRTIQDEELWGVAKVMSGAQTPGAPVYPIEKPILLGGAGGLGLGIAIAILLAIFDTKVHSEEQLSAVFNIPIIGRVPSYGTGEPAYGTAYGGGYGNYGNSGIGKKTDAQTLEMPVQTQSDDSLLPEGRFDADWWKD